MMMTTLTATAMLGTALAILSSVVVATSDAGAVTAISVCPQQPLVTIPIMQSVPENPGLDGQRRWQLSVCQVASYATCASTPASFLIQENGNGDGCDFGFNRQSGGWTNQYGGLHATFLGTVTVADDRVGNLTFLCDASVPASAPVAEGPGVAHSTSQGGIWHFDLRIKTAAACAAPPPGPGPVVPPPAPPIERSPATGFASYSEASTGFPPNLWSLSDAHYSTGLLALDTPRRRVLRAFSGSHYVNNRYVSTHALESIDLLTNATIWRTDDLVARGCDSSFSWLEIVARSVPSTAPVSPDGPPSPADVVLLACRYGAILAYNATDGRFIHSLATGRDIPNGNAPGQTNAVPGDFGTPLPRFKRQWNNGRVSSIFFVTGSYSSVAMSSLHISPNGVPSTLTTYTCNTHGHAVSFFQMTPASSPSSPIIVYHCSNELSIYEANSGLLLVQKAVCGSPNAIFPCTSNDASGTPVLDAIVATPTGGLVAARFDNATNLTAVFEVRFASAQITFADLGVVNGIPLNTAATGTNVGQLARTATPRELHVGAIATTSTGGNVTAFGLVIQCREERFVAVNITVDPVSGAMTGLRAAWMVDNYHTIMTLYRKSNNALPYYLSVSQTSARVMRLPAVMTDASSNAAPLAVMGYMVSGHMFVLDAATGRFIWMHAVVSTNCRSSSYVSYHLSPTSVQLSAQDNKMIFTCSSIALGIDTRVNPLSGTRNLVTSFVSSRNIDAALVQDGLVVVDTGTTYFASILAASAFNLIDGSSNAAKVVVDAGVAYAFSNDATGVVTATDANGLRVWTATALYTSTLSVEPVVFGTYVVQAIGSSDFLVVDLYSGSVVTTVSIAALPCAESLSAYAVPAYTASSVSTAGLFINVGTCAVVITPSLQARDLSGDGLSAGTALYAGVAPQLVGRSVDSVTQAMPLAEGEQWAIFATQAGELVAVDVVSREVGWRVPADELADYGAKVAFAANGNVFVVTTPGSITCRIATSGVKFWREDFPTVSGGGQTVPQAYIYGNTVSLISNGFAYRYFLSAMENGSPSHLDDATSLLGYKGFERGYYQPIVTAFSSGGMIIAAMDSSVMGIGIADANSVPVFWNVTFPTAYTSSYYTPHVIGVSVDPKDPQIVMVSFYGYYDDSNKLMDVYTGKVYYTTNGGGYTGHRPSANTNKYATLSQRSGFEYFTGAIGYNFPTGTALTGDILPPLPASVNPLPPTNVTVPAGFNPPTQPPETLPPIGPLDVSGPPAALPVAWQTTLGAGEAATFTVALNSSFAVVVIVSDHDSNITTLNAATGEVLWFRALSATCLSYTSARSVRVVGGAQTASAAGTNEEPQDLSSGTIVIVCGHHVRAYSALHGHHRWSASDTHSNAISTSTLTAPTVQGDVLVYVAYMYLTIRNVHTGDLMLYTSSGTIVEVRLVSNSSESIYANPSHLLIESTSNFGFNTLAVASINATGNSAALRWIETLRDQYFVRANYAHLPKSNTVLVATGRRSEYYDLVPLNVTAIDLSTGTRYFNRTYNTTFELPNVTLSPMLVAVPSGPAQNAGVAFMVRDYRGIAAFAFDEAAARANPADPAVGRVVWQRNVSDVAGYGARFSYVSFFASFVSRSLDGGLVLMAQSSESNVVVAIGVAISSGAFRYSTVLDSTFTAGSTASYGTVFVTEDVASNTLAAFTGRAVFVLDHDTGLVAAGSRMTSYGVGSTNFVDVVALAEDGASTPARALVSASPFHNYNEDLRALIVTNATSIGFNASQWTAYADSANTQVEVLMQIDGSVVLLHEPRLVSRAALGKGEVLWHAYLPGAPYTGSSAVVHRMGSRIAVRRADRVLMFDAMSGELLSSIRLTTLYGLCMPQNFYSSVFAVIAPGYVTDFTVSGNPIPAQPNGGHDVDGQVLVVLTGGCVYFINSDLVARTLPVQEATSTSSLSTTIAFAVNANFDEFSVLFGAGHLRGVALPQAFVYPSTSKRLPAALKKNRRTPDPSADLTMDDAAATTPLASWFIADRDFSYNSGIYISLTRGAFAVVATPSNLWAIQCTTGQVAWREPIDYYGQTVRMPTVAVMDTLVVFTTYRVIAFNISAATIADTNVSISRKLWTVSQPRYLSGFGPRPVVIADRWVVAATFDGIVQIDVPTITANATATAGYSPSQPLLTLNATRIVGNGHYVYVYKTLISECVGSFGLEPVIVFSWPSGAVVYNVLSKQIVALVAPATPSPSDYNFNFAAQCYIESGTNKAALMTVNAPSSSTTTYHTYPGTIYVRSFVPATSWITPAVPPLPPLDPVPFNTLPASYRFAFPKPTEPAQNNPLPSTSTTLPKPLSVWFSPTISSRSAILVGIFANTSVGIIRSPNPQQIVGWSAADGEQVVWTRTFDATDLCFGVPTYRLSPHFTAVEGGNYVVVSCQYQTHDVVMLDATTGATVANVSAMGVVRLPSSVNTNPDPSSPSQSYSPFIYAVERRSLCFLAIEQIPGTFGASMTMLECAVMPMAPPSSSSSSSAPAQLNATRFSGCEHVYSIRAGRRSMHMPTVAVLTCRFETIGFANVMGVDMRLPDPTAALFNTTIPITPSSGYAQFCPSSSINYRWISALLTPAVPRFDGHFNVAAQMVYLDCNGTTAFRVHVVDASQGNVTTVFINMTFTLADRSSTVTYHAAQQHGLGRVTLVADSGHHVVGFDINGYDAATYSTPQLPMPANWTVSTYTPHSFYARSSGFHPISSTHGLVYLPHKEVIELVDFRQGGGSAAWSANVGSTTLGEIGVVIAVGPTSSHPHTHQHHQHAPPKWVFVGFNNNREVYLLDLQTGTVLWSTRQTSYFGAEQFGLSYNADLQCAVIATTEQRIRCEAVSDRPWARRTSGSVPQVFQDALKDRTAAGDVVAFDGTNLYKLDPSTGNVSSYRSVLPTYMQASRNYITVGAPRGASIVAFTQQTWIWHISTADGSLVDVLPVPASQSLTAVNQQGADYTTFAISNNASVYLVAGAYTGIMRVQVSGAGDAVALTHYVETYSEVVSIDLWEVDAHSSAGGNGGSAIAFLANNRVICYDLATMAEQWNITLTGTSDRYNMNPVVVRAGDYVVVSDGGDQLMMISVSTGQLAWVQNFHIGRYDTSQTTVFNGTAIAIAGNDVIAVKLDFDTSSFAANVNNRAQILWTSSLQQYVAYTPTLEFGPFVSPNGVVIVGVAGIAVGFEAATGRHLWNTTLQTRLRACPTAQPHYAGQYFVLPCYGLTILNVATGQEMPVTDDTYIYDAAYDKSTNKILYTTSAYIYGATPRFDIGADIVPATGLVAPPQGIPPASFPHGNAGVSVPTLPPGVTLPSLDCRVRVDSAAPVFRRCVQQLLTTAYADSTTIGDGANGRPPTSAFANCSLMATALSACETNYLRALGNDCPAGSEYLLKRLSVLADSPVVRICGSNKVDSCQGHTPAADAQLWCDALTTLPAVQGVATLAPGSTVYPSFTWQPVTPPPFSAPPTPTAVPSTPAPTAPWRCFVNGTRFDVNGTTTLDLYVVDGQPTVVQKWQFSVCQVTTPTCTDPDAGFVPPSFVTRISEMGNDCVNTLDILAHPSAAGWSVFNGRVAQEFTRNGGTGDVVVYAVVAIACDPSAGPGLYPDGNSSISTQPGPGVNIDVYQLNVKSSSVCAIVPPLPTTTVMPVTTTTTTQAPATTTAAATTTASVPATTTTTTGPAPVTTTATTTSTSTSTATSTTGVPTTTTGPAPVTTTATTTATSTSTATSTTGVPATTTVTAAPATTTVGPATTTTAIVPPPSTTSTSTATSTSSPTTTMTTTSTTSGPTTTTTTTAAPPSTTASAAPTTTTAAPTPIPADQKFLVEYDRADGVLPITKVAERVAQVIGDVSAQARIHVEPHAATPTSVTYEVIFDNGSDAATFHARLNRDAAAVDRDMGAKAVTPLAAPTGNAPSSDPAVSDINMAVYIVIGLLVAIGVAAFVGIKVRKSRRGAADGGGTSERELSSRNVQLEEQLYDYDGDQQ